MTDYYLGLGYGNTYSEGHFSVKPLLPLTEEDEISDVTFNMSDDKMDYEAIRDEAVAKLQPGDSLIVTYPNQANLYILDEWQDDFHVPGNQREELWTMGGIVETFVHFINAEEENWYWLTDAQVDGHDEDGRPIPVYPADEEE
jgi:hypothetical protein